ncbi:hydrolase [Anaerocolumna cellulosilytica]|uniref:Hydrolase n=1 Tax=Anaerocolumna cellulosilytica TaxID=433286 RepID=A0A6S6R5J1_9FIRM|nr:HAD family hydrolase [Anaerocolumna cellulosilytica]MBB5194707.1 hypothetical protein [Anaerocolumna cellulosilytica]BCJ94331.1 hydrolase [Anaerocolumna cellulosilytica]
MIHIICLDYDMTLFDHAANQIPDSAMKALDNIRDKYKIVLASGRYFNDTLNLQAKELIKPDGIIHANGSVVEAHGEILHEAFFDSGLLQSVVSFSIEHNLTLGGLYEGVWYSTKPIQQKESWLTKGRINFPEVRSIHELLDKKIYSLFLDDTVETAAFIAEKFPSLRTPIMSEKSGGADIIPIHVSKATGMEILLNHWNMTFANVAAVGDSMNDFELIEAATVGIAMGNAVSRLKEIANFITTPISEDGIKNAIEYLESIR